MSSESSDLSSRRGPILWVGGMSGVGKTTGARALARRYDLRLYSLDTRTYVHEARTDPERHPALASFSILSPDALWIDATPEEIVERFVASSRERLELVVEDLAALPDDAPIIVDGPQLLPALIAPLVESPRHAVFLVANQCLQRRLIIERGSRSYSRTRDPARACENRIIRDGVLADRVRREARKHRFALVELEHQAEGEAAIERTFTGFLNAWLARGDRGDVSARRRDENDARLQQWRLYAAEIPEAAQGEATFACECSLPACRETVTLSLTAAESIRRQGKLLLAQASAKRLDR